MPIPKKNQDNLDDASKTLLYELTKKGNENEERDHSNDSPFIDEDGDLKVVPTLESLSELIDQKSALIPTVEILRRNLRITLRAIEMAELAYHAMPKQGTATALTQMQNMARELMKSLEDHQDPEALADEIADVILKPMCMAFVKSLTTELDKKRSSLMSIVPVESSGVIRHELSDLLDGTSKGLDEGYEEAKRILLDVLSGKGDKKKK